MKILTEQTWYPQTYLKTQAWIQTIGEKTDDSVKGSVNIAGFFQTSYKPTVKGYNNPYTPSPDEETLTYFTWPEPEVLIGLYTIDPEFSIGIPASEHYHGN